MTQVSNQVLLICILILSIATQAETTTLKDQAMKAEGAFEVNLEPIKDDATPAGRMIIIKTYTGDAMGSGKGQMVSKRTDGGVAVYAAIEEFEGSVNGKSGAFTLIHNGFMSKESQSLEIKIVPGSGKGELTTISGTLDIVQKDNKHYYTLHYQL